MKIQADKKYQGLCLADEAGSDTIGRYDRLSPIVRHALSQAKFNICPICLIDVCCEDNLPQNDAGLIATIRKIECILET